MIPYGLIAALTPLRDNDTIFVHVWRDDALIATFDGDSLGGLLPLANWPPGVEVVDVRSLSGLPAGRYEVRVGVYQRGDGARYAAYDALGRRLPDDAVAVGRLEVH